MFNEVNYRDSSFRTWNDPIYYGDYHVKEVWHGNRLFYPLGYIYNTTVRGTINSPLAFNFGSLKDVYFTPGAGKWQTFPFQATVNMTIRTPVKPVGFAPLNSFADAGVPFDFEASTLSGMNWMDNSGTNTYKGTAMDQNWAWNKVICSSGSVEPILDTNGEITGFSGLSRKVQTNSILLGLESVQKNGSSVWDPPDQTRGGWEFNVINEVEVMYHFTGDFSKAKGAATSYTSMGLIPGLSIDTLNHEMIGEEYSNAFQQASGQVLKFNAGHRAEVAGLIFEYWLIHDWYPIDNLSEHWYSGSGGMSGVYWKQNGVTGIQVRAYSSHMEDTGIGGVYFVIPFDEIVQTNYHYMGEPSLEDRIRENWNEEKVRNTITSHSGSSLLYFNPRSGQQSWQKSTIFTDDTYFAKEARRKSTHEMNQATNNIYTTDNLKTYSEQREKLLELIKSQLGIPHTNDDPTWDGIEWHSLVDQYWNCSDLVLWCYNSVLGTSYDKNWTYLFGDKLLAGEETDFMFVQDLLPGDLIWSVPSNLNLYRHICMFIGEGKVIGATTFGVKETAMDAQTFGSIYYLRHKSLPEETKEEKEEEKVELEDKMVLEDVDLLYLDSTDITGGSTLWEEQHKANKIYSIEFISGNSNPLPKGQITFHIICMDDAVDNKIVHSQTNGNTLKGRQVIQAPRQVYAVDANTGEKTAIDATSVTGLLIIDTAPDTIEIGDNIGENTGFEVKSFYLKTGSASEIDQHTTQIKLYPN